MCIEPFCYARRGPSLRSNTIHVAGVQGIVLAEQARLLRLTNSEHVCRKAHVYTVCFWLGNGGSDVISPFVDFHLYLSLHLSLFFSLPCPAVSRVHRALQAQPRMFGVGKISRKQKASCEYNTQAPWKMRYINDMELQMRLRSLKALSYIDRPLTGLCSRSFQTERGFERNSSAPRTRCPLRYTAISETIIFRWTKYSAKRVFDGSFAFASIVLRNENVLSPLARCFGRTVHIARYFHQIFLL